jgi:hypothetical protein
VQDGFDGGGTRRGTLQRKAATSDDSPLLDDEGWRVRIISESMSGSFGVVVTKRIKPDKADLDPRSLRNFKAEQRRAACKRIRGFRRGYERRWVLNREGASEPLTESLCVIDTRKGAR